MMKSKELTHFLSGIAAAALDYVYPPVHDCPQCGAEDIAVTSETSGLCRTCFAAFPWVSHESMPAGVVVPARFEGCARSLIFHLKYREALYLAPVMARLMAGFIASQRTSCTGEPNVVDDRRVVVPVPLHKNRQKKRGYNQADLLARHIAGLLMASYEPRALTRLRETAPLYQLSRQERLQNMAGSIVLNQVAAKALRDRHIVLVDDIYTTGATAGACVESLQLSNPASITVTAFALADI